MRALSWRTLTLWTPTLKTLQTLWGSSLSRTRALINQSSFSWFDSTTKYITHIDKHTTTTTTNTTTTTTIATHCSQFRFCLYALCRLGSVVIIYPRHFLVECCKRRLKQGSFVLLYFCCSLFWVLFNLSIFCIVNLSTVLYFLEHLTWIA